MSFILCRECGAQVSDRAGACPRCGAPISVPHQEDDRKAAEKRAYSFLMSNSKYLPENEIPRLRQRLSELSKEQMLEVECISFREPLMLILLSIFLGTLAVDRFVLGHVGLGILKLLLWVLGLFAYIGALVDVVANVTSYSYYYDEPSITDYSGAMTGGAIWLLFWLGAVVWYFVDIFRMSGLTKKYNAGKLYRFLSTQIH